MTRALAPRINRRRFGIVRAFGMKSRGRTIESRGSELGIGELRLLQAARGTRDRPGDIPAPPRFVAVTVLALPPVQGARWLSPEYEVQAAREIGERGAAPGEARCARRFRSSLEVA